MGKAYGRIVLAVVLVWLPLATVFGASRGSGDEWDPYEGTQVLVETYLVEVPLEALKQAEVSPIGEKPDGITITKLMWCLLHDEDALVTSGARLGIRHRNDAQVRQDDRIYRKRVTQVKNKEGNIVESERWDDYSINKELQSTVRVYHEQNISVSYNYQEVRIAEPLGQEKEGPVETRTYRWQGTASLRDGIPEIAGSTQNQEKAIFLVVVATIQHKPYPKEEAVQNL